MKFKDCLFEAKDNIVTFEKSHSDPNELKVEFDFNKNLITATYKGQSRQWKAKDSRQYSIQVKKTQIAGTGGIEGLHSEMMKNRRVQDLFYSPYKGFFMTAFEKGYGKQV